MKAQGKEIGKSLCEDDKLDYAKESDQKKLKIKELNSYLQSTTVAAKEFSNDTEFNAVETVDRISWRWNRDLISDLRQSSYLMAALKDAKTVVWNGPMGVFEI